MSVGMPRRRRPLSLLRHAEPKTQALHAQVLCTFSRLARYVCHWFAYFHVSSCSACVCDVVIVQYGRYQFSVGRPLCYYLLQITAVIHEHAHLKRSLTLAWNVASNWRIKGPVIHRLPTPQGLAKALFALSYLLGFERFAGCRQICSLNLMTWFSFKSLLLIPGSGWCHCPTYKCQRCVCCEGSRNHI